MSVVQGAKTDPEQGEEPAVEGAIDVVGERPQEEDGEARREHGDQCKEAPHGSPPCHTWRSAQEMNPKGRFRSAEARLGRTAGRSACPGSRRDRRELAQRPLHRDRFQAADAPLVRIVQEQEQQEGRRDARSPHHRSCSPARTLLAAVGEQEHEREDDPCGQQQHDPERRGDHALGAVSAVGAGVLAIGDLVEPLRLRGLRGRRARLTVLRVRNIAIPQGFDRVAERAGLHRRPLLVHDVPAVADQLA